MARPEKLGVAEPGNACDGCWAEVWSTILGTAYAGNCARKRRPGTLTCRQHAAREALAQEEKARVDARRGREWQELQALLPAGEPAGLELGLRLEREARDARGKGR